MVLANAIGRGAMALSMCACNWPVLISLGSMVSITAKVGKASKFSEVTLPSQLLSNTCVWFVVGDLSSVRMMQLLLGFYEYCIAYLCKRQIRIINPCKLVCRRIIIHGSTGGVNKPDVDAMVFFNGFWLEF